MKKFSIRMGVGVIAIGVALIAGCRTATSSTGDPTATSLEEPSRPLAGSEVADVQVALAQTVESRGEVRQAVGYYAEAVRNDPTRTDAWARLALLADKEGKFSESEEYHQRAIALQPNNPDLYCNRGYNLYLQGRWDEAEMSLRNAITLKADHRRAHNNLGLVLGRVGRKAEALECFRTAGCSAVDAHNNLAYALTLSGDWAGARQQYELALRLVPDSNPARERLERLDALVAKIGATQKPPKQRTAQISGWVSGHSPGDDALKHANRAGEIEGPGR